MLGDVHVRIDPVYYENWGCQLAQEPIRDSTLKILEEVDRAKSSGTDL